MPPVSWPTASIFCAWRSASSARSRSPTSACSRSSAARRSAVRSATRASSDSFAFRQTSSPSFHSVISWATPMKPICSPLGPQRGCEIERSQRHSPSPLPVARLEREGLQASPRRRAIRRARAARRPGWMMVRQSKIQSLFIVDADEIDIGAVDEAALAIELGHPDRHRRRIGDQPETLLALAKPLLLRRILVLADDGREDAGDRAALVADRRVADAEPGGAGRRRRASAAVRPPR